MPKITLGKTEINVSGNTLSNGDKAPEVTLIDTKLNEYIVGGAKNKTQLILVVPSIDTKVCSKGSVTFDQKIKQLKNIEAVTVSMDLPFALQRFSSLRNINNLKFLSDFRAREFGVKYGVFMEDGILKGLLARAVFIINTKGELIYNEIVPDISQEPSYDDALKAISRFM